jgi:tRNA (guanosine-2'-O-)-methyltransferase
MNERRQNKITAVVAQRRSDIVLVLEDIHDPHNTAAILRTCDAFGIQHIYLIFDKEAPYDPKKIGKASSSSANKWLTFHTFNSATACYEVLKGAGYTIAVTAITPHAEQLNEMSFTEPKIAIVMGNEHSGASEKAITLADKTIAIPMKGFVQSLNVSVAAAVVLWEVTRQKKGTRGLSSNEQEYLTADFLERAGKK